MHSPCAPYSQQSPYRSTSRHRTARPRGALFVAVLVIVLTVGMVGACVLKTPQPESGQPYTSTPRSAWTQGSLPFLYQTDPEWADVAYGGGTIATYGCGPTCLAMVYACLTGSTSYDPAAMGAFSENNGYVESGLTAWRLMTDGAQQLGIHSKEMWTDASSLAAALQNGMPVIASMAPGDFTKEGHFIVLAGLLEDGRVVAHDPNSEPRSSRSWDLSSVASQCVAAWAFWT